MNPADDRAAAHEPPPTTAQVPVDIRSAALTVLAAFAVVLMLQYAQSVIIPVVLGLLVSYALDPIVAALERRHVPRSIGAALLLIVFVGAGGSMLYALRGEANALIAELPDAARRLRQLVETDRPETTKAIHQVQQAASELEKAATAAAPPQTPAGVTRVQLESPPFDVSDYVMWGSLGIAAAVGQLVLILFLVYFLLASGDLYRRKLVKIAGPSLTKKKITVQILSEIDHQIEVFLLVELLASAVVGVATWLAFRGLGVHEAAMWGVIAGVFNSIPYLGPVLVTGAAASGGFIQFGTLHMALVVGATALVISSAEALLLTPRVTSRAARMNAVAVFVGLLFWGWLWRVWGLLLAVPLLMVIKAICDHVEDFQPVGELLGE